MSHIDSKNFTKYSEYSYKAKVEIAKKNKSSNSRELKMLPTYLELAKIDGNYRFNQDEIASITRAFKYYATNLSPVDLLKELLAVGSEVKNPLSAKEIVGFLDATTEMKMVEQKNVLRFLNAAKTKEGTKITPEYLKEAYPYEKFKAREINFQKKYNLYQNEKAFLDENELKSRYEIAIKNQMKSFENDGYRKILSANKCPVSEYITKNNKLVVEAVAKCIDPEDFFSIIDSTGINPNVLASADSLICLYKISGKNESLILDMSRAFYPTEIKQIEKLLFEKAKSSGHKVLPELIGYVSNTYKVYDAVTASSTMPKLNTQRKNVINDLGLKDKIKLLPLSKYEDVYANSMQGERGRNIYQGDFEKGKKR